MSLAALEWTKPKSHFLKSVSLIKQRNNFVGSPNCLAQISAR
jgi:hypothetical protein